MPNRGENDDHNMSMRNHVQRKFLNVMIDSTESWKVLVMDEASTKIVSSALTMYDIMEHRVTLVEQLDKSRQPFPEMDVIYFITPTIESVNLVIDDFQSASKAKYGNVHLFFSDTIDSKVMSVLQSNGLLVSKMKTFQELNIDFLSTENNVFQFGLPDTLERLHGNLSDPDYPTVLGRKLATLCITLNEHPCIRFQGSSPYCREIATVLHQTLLHFKRSNPDFVVYGDDEKPEKERGQILILDRTFDTVSPLMHEYTYQAMVMDLLEVDDGLISYQTTTGRSAEERQALLNESDHLWTELRYNHIAKVIGTIKDRMSDIIQNSAIAKRGAEEQTITAMSAAVRELPEYQQTMNKLGQHVAIAQQCMDAFGREKLMSISQVEQTMSTGVDEEGKDVKGPKLMQLLMETLKSKIAKSQKLRILAIFIASQRNATPDEKRQLIQAAKLSGPEQEVLVNLDRLSSVMNTYQTSSSGAPAKTSMFSKMFRKEPVVHEATAEGEYADTRHVGQLKVLLEQLMSSELPTDRYPALGPAAVSSGEAKSTAKSVRKYTANSRWGKKGDQSQLSGGRYIVFIAGGVGYSELRTAYETMQHNTKEVIIGGSNIISPDMYIDHVAELEGNQGEESKL